MRRSDFRMLLPSPLSECPFEPFVLTYDLGDLRYFPFLLESLFLYVLQGRQPLGVIHLHACGENRPGQLDQSPVTGHDLFNATGECLQRRGIQLLPADQVNAFLGEPCLALDNIPGRLTVRHYGVDLAHQVQAFVQLVLLFLEVAYLFLQLLEVFKVLA